MSYSVKATVRGDNSWCIEHKKTFDARPTPPRNLTFEFEIGSGSGRLVLTWTKIAAPSPQEAVDRASELAAEQLPQLFGEGARVLALCEVEDPTN